MKTELSTNNNNSDLVTPSKLYNSAARPILTIVLEPVVFDLMT